MPGLHPESLDYESWVPAVVLLRQEPDEEEDDEDEDEDGEEDGKERDDDDDDENDQGYSERSLNESVEFKTIAGS
jgi:hypothetical protein